MNATLFESIPDFICSQEADDWIKAGKLAVGKLASSDGEIAYLEWDLIERDPLFGLYSSEKWRKFVLAVFLADLVSYNHPADQVDFERLLFVMHGFPQGFRVWWMKCLDGHWWPVGYTGWYPMFETQFQQFEKEPETLKNRMVVPNKLSSHYLYLFNYSAAPALKKSALTKELVKSFAKDVHFQNARGLSCITVSDEGVRVAERFGMTLSGSFTFEGCQEGVYTVRL